MKMISFIYGINISSYSALIFNGKYTTVIIVLEPALKITGKVSGIILAVFLR